MNAKVKSFIELAQKDAELETRLNECDTFAELVAVAETYGLTAAEMKAALVEMDNDDARELLAEAEA